VSVVVNSSAANRSHRASAPMSYLGDTHTFRDDQQTVHYFYLSFILHSSPAQQHHHHLFFFFGFVIPSSFLSRRLGLHFVVVALASNIPV
jgi:hypothetical protein